jgi:2-hydroxy-3-oxopropionate reductase
MQSIGFIGTGIMGKPMAGNLIKKGYEVMAYNTSPEPLADLEKEGAVICRSVAEVGEKTKTIITMLPNSPQSEEVIIGYKGIINSAKKGTIVIDMSSIDPMVSIKIGKELSSKGIEFLDAPVSGGEPKAIDGTLAIMVGGKKEIFNQVIPVFEVLGSSYNLVGGIGAGNFTKLSNQIIVAINIAAVSEALLLAKKAGLSPQKVFDAIRGGLAGSAVLDSKAPMMIEKNFKPGFKIKLHQKDMQNVINASSSLNIPLPLSAQLLETLKSLTASGNGELDHSAIIKYFENISTVEL